jgi:prepilin-type N-terminal cleavage/methylation domain-containing protein
MAVPIHSAPSRPSARPALPRRGAFTLIELLTVIAIIGILAAIIVPTVGRVRESAKTSQCGSNLRQIAMALMLYANDNKDRLPPAKDADGIQWSKAIDTYLPQRGTSATAPENKVFVCPSADYAGEDNDTLSRTYAGTDAIRGTTASGTKNNTSVQKLGNIPERSRTPILAEAKQPASGGKSGPSIITWAMASSDFAQANPGQTTSLDHRHSSKNLFNLAFADASVRPHKPADAAALTQDLWEGRRLP